MQSIMDYDVGEHNVEFSTIIPLCDLKMMKL